MSKYDDRFDETTPDASCFADKGALDPLGDPDEIHARDVQERELATILNGVHEGYLPPMVSVYGPSGTGKTLTTRRVVQEFAARAGSIAVKYVTLKGCRTPFRAATAILVALTGKEDGLRGPRRRLRGDLDLYSRPIPSGHTHVTGLP
jgi:archaeal cell division control protein 6